MPTWLSYAPRDFLMFGPEVYWRLFELQTRALWPVPVIAALAGLALLLLPAMRKRTADRAALLLVALACLGAAHFLATRYAPINWPAGYAAWAFVVEAAGLALLALIGCHGQPASPPRAQQTVGWALLGLAVILYPVLGPAFGRPIAQAEIVGLAPDPTAIACLGMLSVLNQSKFAVLLAVIPVAWCAFSAAILLTLGEGQGWILIGSVLLWGTGLVMARAIRHGERQRH